MRGAFPLDLLASHFTHPFFLLLELQVGERGRALRVGLQVFATAPACAEEGSSGPVRLRAQNLAAAGQRQCAGTRLVLLGKWLGAYPVSARQSGDTTAIYRRLPRGYPLTRAAAAPIRTAKRYLARRAEQLQTSRTVTESCWWTNGARCTRAPEG